MKVKAKDSETNSAASCFGNVSKKFSLKVGLYEYFYDLIDNFNSIDVDNFRIFINI